MSGEVNSSSQNLFTYLVRFFHPLLVSAVNNIDLKHTRELFRKHCNSRKLPGAVLFFVFFFFLGGGGCGKCDDTGYHTARKVKYTSPQKAHRMTSLRSSCSNITQDQNFTHQHICIFKIISPVRPNFPLPTDVPHIQFERVLGALYTLYVEALSKWKVGTSRTETSTLYTHNFVSPISSSETNGTNLSNAGNNTQK